jgi:hypothetical protein
MMTAKEARMIAERYAKAVELVEQGRVFPLHNRPNEFAVINGQGEAYWVQLAAEETHCDCEDFRYRGRKLGLACKHILAAQLYLERRAQPASGGTPRTSVDQSETTDEPRCDRCGEPLADRDYCLACSTKMLLGPYAA